MGRTARKALLSILAWVAKTESPGILIENGNIYQDSDPEQRRERDVGMSSGKEGALCTRAQ